MAHYNSPLSYPNSLQTPSRPYSSQDSALVPELVSDGEITDQSTTSASSRHSVHHHHRHSPGPSRAFKLSDSRRRPYPPQSPRQRYKATINSHSNIKRTNAASSSSTASTPLSHSDLQLGQISAALAHHNARLIRSYTTLVREVCRFQGDKFNPASIISSSSSSLLPFPNQLHSSLVGSLPGLLQHATDVSSEAAKLGQDGVESSEMVSLLAGQNAELLERLARAEKENEMLRMEVGRLQQMESVFHMMKSTLQHYS